MSNIARDSDGKVAAVCLVRAEAHGGNQPSTNKKVENNDHVPHKLMQYQAIIDEMEKKVSGTILFEFCE